MTKTMLRVATFIATILFAPADAFAYGPQEGSGEYGSRDLEQYCRSVCQNSDGSTTYRNSKG